MWIVLNPKTHRFTTKNINMYKGAPTAFVGPDVDNETLATIERAIADGRLLRVQGNAMDGMTIPNQAKLSSVDTEDTDAVVSATCVRDKNGKILSTIITMPDEDGNIQDGPPKQMGVILTDVRDEPLDEDEEEG